MTPTEQNAALILKIRELHRNLLGTYRWCARNGDPATDGVYICVCRLEQTFAAELDPNGPTLAKTQKELDTLPDAEEP